MKKLTGKLLASLLVAGAMSASASSNLILNGNFATGNFTDWTESQMDVYSYRHPADASYAAESGNAGTLYQSFPTTAGDTYLLSFATYNDMDNTGGYYVAEINGASLPIAPSVTDAGQWDVNTTSFTASSSTSTLLFDLNFAAASGDGYISDISVTPVGVPEPGMLALGAMGAAGLVVGRHRRRRGR